VRQAGRLVFYCHLCGDDESHGKAHSKLHGSLPNNNQVRDDCVIANKQTEGKEVTSIFLTDDYEISRRLINTIKVERGRFT
jgi:hypothetical protein